MDADIIGYSLLILMVFVFVVVVIVVVVVVVVDDDDKFSVEPPLLIMHINNLSVFVYCC